MTSHQKDPPDYYSNMQICVIMDNQLGIAKDGCIPWDLPEVKKRFEHLVSNQIVIMGHNTWRAPPFSTKNSVTYVLSHHKTNATYTVSNTVELKRQLKESPYDSHIYVVGGAQIFELLLPYVNHIHVAWILSDTGCDTFMPLFPEFKLIWVSPETITENDITYEYRIFERSSYRPQLS